MPTQPPVVDSIIPPEGPAQLVLRGKIDASTARPLYQVARSLLERGRDVQVCCAQAEHLGTTAVQVLLALKAGLEARGRKLSWSGAADRVASLLRLAGLAAHLPVA